MTMVNDRKGAIKKLKSLAYTSKINVESYRKKMDSAFKTVFLPNGVERTEVNYGGVTCDLLSPEIYASNRIILYVHGGCFTGGSRVVYKAFCSSIASKCYSRVVIPEYRLSPASPYPAAIEDIQSVFRAVFTEEQINASLNATSTSDGKTSTMPEIIIMADGAGASIASALVFNLRERFRSCISHIVFFSPWLDLSEESRLITIKKVSDEILSGDNIRKSVTAYTFAANTNIPAVSPLMAKDDMLKDFPPVFIQMGEKEILLPDAKTFKNRLTALGNTCELDIWPDMMFMFQMADEYLHESHLALDKIGKVITKNDAGEAAVEIDNQPKLEHSLKSEA